MVAFKKALQPTKRALVVEDYETTRNDIKQELEAIGYEVDAFETPKEAASKISRERYQLSIIDIRIDGYNISGEEFVRKNRDVLGKGTIVAYTAYWENIIDETLFNKIIHKGSSPTPLNKFAKEIFDKLVPSKSNEVNYEGNPDWHVAKKKLLDTLSKIEDKKEPMIWYKSYELSAQELIDAVNSEESAVGKHHIRMMLNWNKRDKKFK